MSIKDYQPRKNIPEDWGEKTTLSQLVGKIIHVLDHFQLEGEKTLYVVKAYLEDEKKNIWFYTSSNAIIRDLPQAPFRAKVIQKRSKTSGRKYLAFDVP